MLAQAFEAVKDSTKPVVVHIHTVKGHGLSVAEENKEAFHWILPGTLDKKDEPSQAVVENYTTLSFWV